MIARQIEVNIRPDRYDEFKSLVESDVLPILKRQNGFLDSLSLVTENTMDRHIVITLWKTKNDAEIYQKREFPKIFEMLKPFLTGTPTVDYFNVEHTSFRKVDSVAA